VHRGTFFPDDSPVLVLDGHVAFYDKSLKQIHMCGEHKLGGWDIAAVSSSWRGKVAITCPDAKALRMRRSGSWERGKWLEDVPFIERCYGIAATEDGLLWVSCDGEPECIKVVEQDGKSQLSMISMRTGHVVPKGETYIATDATGSYVVVSNCQLNCVKCFTSAGDLVWTKSVPGASGVAVVGPCILVASKSSGFVQSLNFRGDVIKILTRQSDGIKRPRVLAVNGKETKLLVVEEGSTTARVFQITSLEG
jgi:hypothetical protein